MAGIYRIKVDEKEINKVENLLSEIPQVIIPRALDKLTTTIAAKGRHIASKTEASKLHMGSVHAKGQNRGGVWTLHKGGTRWNGTSKVYTSIRANKLKMQNFNFETVAFSRRRKIVRNISEVSVTSQIQNLWAKDTKPYTKRSPVIWQNLTNPMSIQKGKTRRARTSFDDFRRDIGNGLDMSVSFVDKWLQEEINKIGL